MSKTNNKHMVERIQKLAQVGFFPGSEPSKGTPTPAAPTPAPATRPTAPGAPGYFQSPNIQKMQAELTTLARTVTNQLGTQVVAPSPKDTPEEAAAKQSESKARVAFNNFIAQHYTRNSDVKAVEFDPDPTKTQMSQKNPTKPHQMNVVMDTMSRVGGSKSEFSLDGKWGPRTNAALRNAYALAFSLLNMSHDLGYTPKSYSQQSLAAFKELIPLHDTEIPNAEKIKRANEIVPNLQAIRNLVNEVNEHVLNKPAFRQYIEGSRPYVTYQRGAVSPQVLSNLNEKFNNIKIEGPGAHGPISTWIFVEDLASPEALKAWQQKHMPQLPLQDILAQVKQYLNTVSVSNVSNEGSVAVHGNQGVA